MTTLRLRRARADDCRLLWEWVNDPGVRAASFNSSEIPWQTHVKWYDARLRSDRCVIYIVETIEGMPVGQVRFDRDVDAAEVGVSIGVAWRGRGLGPEALRLACAAFQAETGVPIIARIRAANAASVRAFEKAGFTQEGREQVGGHEGVRLVRRAPTPSAATPSDT